MTMVEKFCAFVVLVLCALAGRSSAQDCVPKTVANLTVDSDHYLSWSIRASEECEITSFLVHIFRPDHAVEYTYSVTEPRTDVKFLGACQEWTFVVIAIADVVRGPEYRVVQYMPLPSEADLSIRAVTIFHNRTTNEYQLVWDLSDTRYGTCSLKYRVTIEENFSPVIEDVYVDNNMLSLHFLSPCTLYLYSVRAINMAHPTIEGPLQTAEYVITTRRQTPPTLVSVDSTPTALTLSYRLESYIRNPCPIREFSIDGGQYFSKTVSLQDNMIRPLVNVTIESLRPNSMYILRASVQNSGGWSQQNIAAVQTPDLAPGEA